MSRILIGLGVAILVCAVYLWFFGFQTMMVWEMHNLAKRAPVVKLTPRSLPDSSVSQVKGKTLTYFGYQFEVPWDDVDDSKTKLYPNRVVLASRSGKAMIFSVGQPREFVQSVLQQGNQDSLRQTYGDVVLRSDYAMWRAVAEATPDKVTLFTPRKDIVATCMLLVIKGIAAPEESAIYSVANKDFKGFQWGDPQSLPRHIVADLFADDAGLEFIFAGPGKGKPLGISQAEINRVLQTVHKL